MNARAILSHPSFGVCHVGQMMNGKRLFQPLQHFGCCTANEK
jgi:hypothetical protein